MGLAVALHAPVAAANDAWNENEADLAKDPRPRPPPPAPPLTPLGKLLTAPLIYDVELRAAVGWATLGDDDGSIAELTTGGADLVFNMGAFVTRHLKMGYEATGGQRTVLESRQGEQGYLPSPIALETDATYLLPIGGYAAFYPLADAGLSVGVHFGGGVFWGADYIADAFLVPWAGSAAADVGYDHILSDDVALGVRARCGALGFTTSDEDGHTATMNVTELSLAVHLSAF